MATTSTPVTKLKINKLTKAQYDGISNPSATELYFVKDEAIDYNDLVNKPTIGDGNLVIQRNNSNVGSFNANDVNDNIINIDVPTQPSDIGAMPASTKYAASIKVTMNTSNYQVTFQLKDQGGSNIGSAQTIDLPIESVIVNGYYDANTKEVVLVLQNGTEIRFSVADLISGLQSEITPTNMLDSDLVDDSNAAHKFVTTTDKDNWNNKVDKTTAGSQVYVTTAGGAQTSVKYTANVENGTIVQRGSSNGQIAVPQTPTSDGHAASKKYVDTQDNLKVDKVSTANKVYGTDANGNQTTYDKGSFGQVDDVQVDGTSVVTNKIASLGSMASEDKDDYTPTADLAAVALDNEYSSLSNKPKVNGTVLSSTTPVWFGSSTTAAATAVKEVSIPNITSLDEGVIIIVTPTITSTVANSSIKLNNFTAYPMLYQGNAITTSTDSIVWLANTPSMFYFNGSNWLFLGHGVDTNTTYSAMSVSEGTTGTATNQRTVRADYLKQIIQGTTLTGITFTDTDDVTARDSITTAIGKLQANVTDLHDNKQDNIVDLQTIREGAAFGATAVQPGDLATVATTGNYNDLSNKPTIGNGTLTIQKNGTTVATFTANQTGNTTANILADEVKTDNVTISKDANDKLQAIGTLQKNGNTPKYDWIGTLAEYNALGTYRNDWLYYITDDNVISNPTADNTTIVYTANEELQAIGVIDKNTNAPKYDWIGTLAEYQAQDIETLHPNWLCYITDDMSGGPSVYTKNEVDNLVLTQVESQVREQLAEDIPIAIATKVDKGHEVIEFQAPTAENNYTWYRKYADGWVEQGGIITAPSDAAYVNNLPITMIDTNYIVMITRDVGTDYSTNINGRWQEVYNKTTTSFTTWGMYASKPNIMWQVSGMAASN